MKTAFLLALVLCVAPCAAAADTPAPDIRKIPITIYPHNVLVVRGTMVELDKLKDHLAALVPDAKKSTVEVTVYPNSKAEMGQVAEIVRLAREAGYTKVSYESPPVVKELPQEIAVLVSRTGVIIVDDVTVKEDELKAHLEKKVAAEDRPKVRVYVRFTRLAPMKKVSAVVKICKDAGYVDVVAGVIAE